MKVQSLRLAGIRCFEDTGDIELSRKCNIFVGQNNAGKSTLLRGILAWQGMGFSPRDHRATSADVFCAMTLMDVLPTDHLQILPTPMPENKVRVVRLSRGTPPAPPPNIASADLSDAQLMFHNQRPDHMLVPFLAKRKAVQFDHNITLASQAPVTGTLANLYARVDMLAGGGHPRHQKFQEALIDIVGLPITTTASASGKEAGFFIDDSHFVPLEQMGDGVTEMVALIVELCVESGKVFVLEEPETNLHPFGLKALLEMVRNSSDQNQFVIATHSNIVVRELAFDDATKVFRVFRDSNERQSPSHVELVPNTPQAHMDLLRELGYEFADFGLFEAWLLLEEGSARSVIRDILIPVFVPELRGRLRTFSAAGVSNVEPSLSEFQRLMTFLHLEPIYRDRAWVRTDGDAAGLAVVEKLRQKFPYLNDNTCAAFHNDAFERYYPSQFSARVASVLGIQDRRAKQTAKQELLRGVLEWSRASPEEAQASWAVSASEIIELLGLIKDSLN